MSQIDESKEILEVGTQDHDVCQNANNCHDAMIPMRCNLFDVTVKKNVRSVGLPASTPGICIF